jgi:hypothetical protein
LVGDPVEVDDKFLIDEGKIRVKVLCKDATKIKGTTLLYINGQGHLLSWYSEKLQILLGKDPQDSDYEDEESDEEEDKEEEYFDSHDSGFARLGKELEEEEDKMGQGGSISQKDDLEGLDHADLDRSQTAPTNDQDTLGEEKVCLDEEMLDVEDALEREEEMRLIDHKFEEKHKNWHM